MNSQNSMLKSFLSSEASKVTSSLQPTLFQSSPSAPNLHYNGQKIQMPA